MFCLPKCVLGSVILHYLFSLVALWEPRGVAVVAHLKDDMVFPS